MAQTDRTVTDNADRILIAAGTAEHLGADGTVASLRTLLLGNMALASLEMQRSVLLPDAAAHPGSSRADSIQKISRSLASLTSSLIKLPGAFETGPAVRNFQRLADHVAGAKPAKQDDDEWDDPVSELERQIFARAGIGAAPLDKAGD